VAKPNNKDNAKRVLALPDIHYPLHDQRSLSCVERFIPDFAPTHVVYIGDVMQMDSVSHWLADKRRSLEGQRLLKDYEGTNALLDRHQALAPDATFVLILGNHEDWVRQYIDLHPEMEGLLEVDRCLRLRERHFTTIPFGSSYQVGKLYYMHGVYTNEHHSKSTVMAFQRNVRYGHTHDIQQYTWMSPVDQDSRHSASSIGCLCNVNPHYMKHKPNRWMHGFSVAFVRSDGTFTDFTIPIVKGKFTYEGKTYVG
jgi:predicted MPP superfamily phosphohydrolase